MAHYKPMREKSAGDGKKVTLYRDHAHAWFVGREGDPNLEPIPMGAFGTEEAARNWADHHFPGGEWRDL